MNHLPTPEEARQLRAMFAGNPIIDRAESALRVFDEALHIRDAAEMLELWEHNAELTDRERSGVLARFVPPPSDRCARCGGPIAYVTDGPDPGWWKHTDSANLSFPHGVVPHYTGGAL